MADDETRRETSRLWRVWKTTKQLCYDRVRPSTMTFEKRSSTLTHKSQGYELAEDELDVSLDQFRDQCGDGSGAVKYVLPYTFFTPTTPLPRRTSF